jgi:phosphopantothenoylcysteine decarboxylase/phosphopantothenate--cysteine ligase
MHDAVERAVDDADLLIMAAAVADFRPAVAARHKIKKLAGTDKVAIDLVRNPDILASVDRPGLVKIGFAAETEDIVANAARKLKEKGLDMIVANDAEAAIGSDENQATIMFADGSTRELPRMTKRRLADEIIDLATALLVDRDRTIE